jgi:hypothetical protein
MEWKDFLNNGTPLLMLTVGCYALWRTAQWAKGAVVEPVVAAILDLIKTLKEQLSQQGEDLKAVAAIAKSTADKHEQQLNNLTSAVGGLQAIVKQQTTEITGAIDYQTQCIEDRASRKPNPGSLQTPPPKAAPA